MIARMSVRVVSAKEVKGGAWALRYPARASDLWLIAHANGKRKRKWIGPDTPENREKAELKRKKWTKTLLGKGELEELVAPPFAAIAEAFLDHGLQGKASNTRNNRRWQIKALVAHFGDTRMDAIDLKAVTKWWSAYVRKGGRDFRTGMSSLDALSVLFRFAVFEGHDVRNPVPDARSGIRPEYVNTAEYRSRNERNCRPLELTELAALARVLPEGADMTVATLLLMDAGLRISEMMALEWGDCWFGRDEMDTSRHLHVCHNVSSSNVPGLPKTGRARDVGMSRRLRTVLLQRQMKLGRPSEGSRVIESLQRVPYRQELRRLCKHARVRPVRPKDLRDTFASLLVTMGIPVKYVANQIGDSVTTTDRHYGRWIDSDGYRNPTPVADGELPCDLLSRPNLGRATTTPPYATTSRKPT